MRLITLSLFAFLLLAGTAFGQEQGENGTNELTTPLAALIAVYTILKILVVAARTFEILAGLLTRLFEHEMFETERVFGGTCGAVVALGYLITDVQVGPIVGLALLGGVLGTRNARILGTIIGAILGFAFAIVVPRCYPGLNVFLDPQLWFAVSLVPLGGLIAGKLWR